METGLVGALGSLFLAAGVAAQPLDVVAAQSPSQAVGPQVSHELTGGQTTEPTHTVTDDFIAQHDATAERIRVFALPTINIYAIRLRFVELDAQGNELAELSVMTAGSDRLLLDKSDTQLTAYEVELDAPFGLRIGARYGVQAVGLLTAPTLGDESLAWRWAGAEGDGSIFVDEGAGPMRLDHPGVAFEVLGEILTPVCLVDVNGDGLLSPADFNAWILAFNAADPAADQNGDGLVTPSDFNAWIANYNAGC